MYTDLDQIIKDFNLDSKSKDSIRKELKSRLKKFHPDKNGGEFGSKEQKLMFEKISHAIDFIDTPVDVVLRREITDLTKVIKDLAIKRNAVDLLSTKEDELYKRIEGNIKSFASTHRFPKITTSVIAGLLSIIWVFPKTITEHQVLSRIMDTQSPIFTIFWLVSIIMATQLWLFLSILERKDKERKNSLKIESVQNSLFNEFVRYRIRDERYERNSSMLRFTKEEFMDFIRGFNLRTKKINPQRVNTSSSSGFLFGDSRIDTGLSQDLSDIILGRMQAKELIVIKTQKTISDIYLMKIDKDMEEHYYH